MAKVTPVLPELPDAKPSEMTREQKLAVLQRDNPGKQRKSLELFLATLEEYQDAQRKVDEGGTVAAHPRTGAPISNPYLAVRDRALRRLTKTWTDVVTNGLDGVEPESPAPAGDTSKSKRQGPPAPVSPKAPVAAPVNDEQNAHPTLLQAYREARSNRIRAQASNCGQRDLAQMQATEARLLAAIEKQREERLTDEERLLGSRAWMALRDKLLGVLEKYPDVLAEVLEVLKL